MYRIKIRNIRKYIIVSIFIVLFPYLFTLALHSDKEIGWFDNEDYDLKILLESDGYTKKMSIERFIPYVLAYQMEADADEDELEKRSILIRTMLYALTDGNEYITADDMGIDYMTFVQMQAKYGDKADEAYEIFSSAVKNTEDETIKISK
ncbi:MAG: SpoIID/LytB domain-containing protein [Eubacterium sp.]